MQNRVHPLTKAHLHKALKLIVRVNPLWISDIFSINPQRVTKNDNFAIETI